MKQFDDIFSRKARDAFDGYNADHLADAGWDSFLKKQGKKRWLAIVIPLWAKAASVALLIGVGTIITYRAVVRDAGEGVVQMSQTTPVEATAPSVSEEAITTQKVILAKADPPKETPVGSDKLADPASGSKTEMAATIVPASVRGETTEAAGMIDARLIGENSIPAWLPDATEEELLGRPEELFYITDDDPVVKRKTTLMTGMSGMMASVENATSTSGGVSFGVYVEQELTRRISVRPGVALAVHNYGLANTPTGEMALDYSAPTLNGLSGRTSSYEANIEAITMALPVDFVFSVWKRSGSSLFVSTGLSTVFYLSQRLSGSFDNTYTKTSFNSTTGETTYESQTSTVEIESSEKPFSHIDLFGLANFSAGYSMPFGKTNVILFEPFVQLPVGDISSMNLKIRYGGLSMKIQF